MNPGLNAGSHTCFHQMPALTLTMTRVVHKLGSGSAWGISHAFPQRNYFTRLFEPMLKYDTLDWPWWAGWQSGNTRLDEKIICKTEGSLLLLQWLNYISHIIIMKTSLFISQVKTVYCHFGSTSNFVHWQNCQQGKKHLQYLKNTHLLIQSRI